MRFHRALMLLALSAIVACSGGESQQAASSGSGGSSSSSSASSSVSSSTATSSASTSSASSSSTSSASSSSSGAGGSSSSSSSGAGGGGSGLLAELKAGPWLFGWSGGLDHYSWVRFNFANATQGSVDVLDAKCPSCAAYWQCQGQGLFSADPMTSTISLQLPQGCNNMTHTLVITMLFPPGGFPPKATLAATVTDNGNNISGYEFPPAQCDAQFTTCGDPLQ